MQITIAVSSSEFDWFTSCRAIDAMVMFNTPFRGQQELSLLGAEQTTSSLVVMISGYRLAKPASDRDRFATQPVPGLPFDLGVLRQLCQFGMS